MKKFSLFALTPAGCLDAGLAIAACRSGRIGVLNAELPQPENLVLASVSSLAQAARNPFGLKLHGAHLGLMPYLKSWQAAGLSWLILPADSVDIYLKLPDIQSFRVAGGHLLVEALCWTPFLQDIEGSVDGYWVKGHECGGQVGDEGSFVLLQRFLAETERPVYVRGGVGVHTAAAIHVAGGYGCVLDSQLLLLDESPLRDELQRTLENLVGTECGLFGDEETGVYLRLLERPGFAAITSLRSDLDSGSQDASAAGLSVRLAAEAGWDDPDRNLFPLGQDAAFAAPYALRYRSLPKLFAAIETAVHANPRQALKDAVLAANAPLAKAHAVRYPIVQGAMTRVSDVAPFAKAVGEAGALPMIALALMRGDRALPLLQETQAMMGEKSWGVGILGFVPKEIRQEQMEAILKVRPPIAYIAGGRPDQAMRLEKEGIRCYLHVPTVRLLHLFLDQGARRFIFEGRECGGHIGPLSSFVLWESAITELLDWAGAGGDLAAVSVLFAGGIHDARSAAMVAALAAPLTRRGAQIGVLMGTAYLYTREAVQHGAILERFQQIALACTSTSSLTTGPGHSSRCVRTPFVSAFHQRKRELLQPGVDGRAASQELDELTLGRLRVATKGVAHVGDTLEPVPDGRQVEDGLYMIGQVATLRHEITDCAQLHRSVTDDAMAYLGRFAAELAADSKSQPGRPADVAIIGIGTLLPKAADSRTYWRNIVTGLNCIGEIPADRWDWRLYFDQDRHAADKIYSKWGGFIDDVEFDPTRYGMPPNSLKSIDPAQLLTLEVVRQSLEDAGIALSEVDRERIAVILGASGGLGEMGLGYSVRADLPRTVGQVGSETLDRLPEWTEDSFAGILMNVAAGRCANRFDFGGINATVDAACASSLAAVYQAVNELVLGKADIAVAGGVDTVQSAFAYLCFSKTQALSPQGKSRSLDEETDGIVISEGLAAVVLKRLADAERDGDRIYAVIKGVGGSSDGRAKGLTAPYPEGQIRALNRAYAEAGYSPASLGLVEAHGTGTVAGDRAELETVSRVVKEHRANPGSCAIGSVKTQIGHTKSAAGVCGLIKATLALHHQVLPPHIGVTRPQAVLRDPENPLYLCPTPSPWIRDPAHPRRAGVSAFGFGGTNFHVTLEEVRRPVSRRRNQPLSDDWPTELLLWQCKDKDTLKGKLANLLAAMDAGARPRLADLAFSLAQDLDCKGGLRLALVSEDNDALKGQLVASLAQLEDATLPLPPGAHFRGEPMLANGGKLAVLFAGQGAQHLNMLRELALYFAPLRDALARADQLLEDGLVQRLGAGARLSKLIYPPARFDAAVESEYRKRLNLTEYAQPAIGALSAGLWALMRELGIQADMAGGHSYGEYVALHAAGVLDLDGLVLLSEARGRFVSEAAAGGDLGCMLAVPSAKGLVEAQIAGIKGVSIANHNSPQQTVLAGKRAGILQAQERLKTLGIDGVLLPVSAAFHSSLVEPARCRLADFMAGIPFGAPQFPVFSNTLARMHESSPDRIRETMASHLVKPVRYNEEIEAMHKAGARVFLELGPKAIQTRLVGQILAERPHRAIAVDGQGGGLAALLEALACVFCEGGSLNSAFLYTGRNTRLMDLSREGLRVAGIKPPLSPHVWLVNGTHTKRPGTVGAIGKKPTLRLGEQTEFRPNGQHRFDNERPLEVADMSDQPVYSGAQPYANGHAPAAATPQPRAAVSNLAADEVMAAYQQTMRQFLALQERVMSSYFTGVPAAMPAPAPMQAAPPMAMIATPVQVIAPPPVPAPHLQAALAATPTPTVSTLQVSVSAVLSAPVQEAVIPDAKTLLLDIAADRTGYPVEMLGLDQDLEADLGIDSIKRVEILGALQKAIPAAQKQILLERMEELVSLRTFRAMITWLDGVLVGGAVVRSPECEETVRPFDQAGEAIIVAPLPRHLVKAHPESLAGVELPPLPKGLYLATADCLGVAEQMAELIKECGGRLVFVPEEVFWQERAYADWLNEQRRGESVRGFLHLLPLGEPSFDPKIDFADWKARMKREVKSVFGLLRPLARELSDGGRLITVSGMGGHFGRDYAPEKMIAPAFPGGAGLAGLVKTLGFEWNRDLDKPNCTAKVVDLDPLRSAEELARSIYRELALFGGRREVGYPNGERTIFRTTPASLSKQSKNGIPQPDSDWVVLATGGARGITAEVLREFMPYKVRLVLVGRTPLPEPEDEATAACLDTTDLRTHFLKEAKQSGEKPRPAQIQQRIRAMLAARELLANVADFEASGIRVDYRALDASDGAAMESLIGDLYRRYGRIDAVVHGAGIIEDKLFVDKSPESVDRVFDTKVDSAFLLVKHLRMDSLKFLCLFTSVAGRYGNAGQSDYAAANETINRLALILNGQYGDKLKIASLNWDPWGPTTHGVGMATPEIRRQFAERGVRMIEAPAGRGLFINEILYGPFDQVEIIAGDSWEHREARAATLPAELGTALQATKSLFPLLRDVKVEKTTTGGWRVIKYLDLVSDPYLDHHRIDGIPVLPFMAVAEHIAEATALLLPDGRVAALSDLRLLKGIRLIGESLCLHVDLEPRGEDFSVSVSVGEEETRQVHYRAVVQMGASLSEAPIMSARADIRPAATSAAEAYRRWLFHGPVLQTITCIDGIDEHALLARLKPSRPQALWPLEDQAQWLFDVPLLDGALQLMGIWSRAIRNTTCLPTRIGRLERHGSDLLPDVLVAHLEVVSDPANPSIQAHIALCDESGRPRILLHDCEGAATVAMNRIGGAWAGGTPELSRVI